MKTKQQSTEEKRTSTPKTTRHTSPQERTRTDKHLNKNSKTEGSRRVQIQFKFKFKFKTTSNQFPRTCNKQTCYDPQLQGCLIWHCHLSVQQRLQQRSRSTTRCKTISKQSSENCQPVELQNHDNCENVAYIV